MTTIAAISDIHGHYGQLVDLLEKIENCGTPIDEYVFLGDYVDGGSETRQVLELLRNFELKATFLMGNHEDLLLDAVLHNGVEYNNFMLWWGQGGYETYRSFAPFRVRDIFNYPPVDAVATVIGEDVLTWLDNLPTIYETDHYIFVHGGLHDGSLKGTIKRDRLWLRDEFIKSAYDWGKIVVFGHTPFKEPLIMPNKIGLDTMHHNAGAISGAILNDEGLVQLVQSYRTT